MSDSIISVEGVGKCYRIRHQSQPMRYVALRDVIAYRFKQLFRSRVKAGGQSATIEDFWALQDVSFEVKRGEVVGIIGRNGAGKSTLLKIFSRITEPTQGRVRINGRVASLLEVGTGFHPELTGRENIFLNGAILGMKRAEIRAKFDEIVAFAEVEKFLDTPVKRYSSGMYVRLAFAVAAHLEPEILIVDEVLAVGDAQFQRKCLGKMKEVGAMGRTVLLVSHNMPVVQSLCRSAVLLVQGRVVDFGPADKVVTQYLSAAGRNLRLSGTGDFPGRQAGALPVIRAVELINQQGTVTSSVPVGAAVTFRLQLAPPRRISRPVFGLGIDNAHGMRLASFNSHMNMMLEVGEITQPTTVECVIPSLPLMPGEYRVKLVVHEGTADLDTVEEALTFTVEPSDWYGTGRLPSSTQGVMVCRADWRISPDA